MHEAKTHFSKLVRKANAGERIIVTNRGEPVAEITPLKPVKTKRQPGFMKGRLPTWSGETWEKMDREILADFEKSANEPLAPNEP